MSLAIGGFGATLEASGDLSAIKDRMLQAEFRNWLNSNKSAETIAQELGIKKVIFDRNGFKYHGRVKALADGAREAGLSF